jgi:hypothetical protein
MLLFLYSFRYATLQAAHETEVQLHKEEVTRHETMAKLHREEVEDLNRSLQEQFEANHHLSQTNADLVATVSRQRHVFFIYLFIYLFIIILFLLFVCVCVCLSVS